MRKDYYERDNQFYQSWDEISRSRADFLAWMKANVIDGTRGSICGTGIPVKMEEVA